MHKHKTTLDRNIKIEKFTSADFAYYFRLVGNEQVMAMITERAIPLEEARADFERLIQNNALHPDFGNFKMLDAVSNGFIGLAKLEIKEKDSEEAELGYVVLPEHWGKGIAGSAAKQLIEVAKTQHTLKRLFAIIDPNNTPSRKILVNNGFISKEFRDFDGLPGEVLELNLR